MSFLPLFLITLTLASYSDILYEMCVNDKLIEFQSGLHTQNNIDTIKSIHKKNPIELTSLFIIY